MAQVGHVHETRIAGFGDVERRFLVVKPLNRAADAVRPRTSLGWGETDAQRLRSVPEGTQTIGDVGRGSELDAQEVIFKAGAVGRHLARAPIESQLTWGKRVSAFRARSDRSGADRKNWQEETKNARIYAESRPVHHLKNNVQDCAAFQQHSGSEAAKIARL